MRFSWVCSTGLEREHDGVNPPHACGNGNMGGVGAWLVRDCKGNILYNGNVPANRGTIEEDPCGEGDTGILIDIENQLDNCEKLLNLSKNDALSANINPILYSLRLKTGLNKEWSCNFRRFTNYGEIYTSAQNEGIIEGITKTKSTIYTGTTWIGQVHTHPKNTYPMFSWNDLKAIKDVYNEVHADFKKDVFLMIVNDDGSVYSLKINDIDTLITALNNDLASAKGNSENKKEEKIAKDLAKEFNKNNNLERTFLNLYGNHGLSLYKATDNNLSNWKRLELDENNNKIVNEIPCN